jgi:Gpi18-like mannosyltransferase
MALQVLMFCIEGVFLFGVVVVFRTYLAQFFRSSIISSMLAFTVFLVLPYNYLLAPMYTQPFNNPPAIYHPIFYMYDLPSLFFFTLGMLLLSRRKMAPFYILFAIATLNRETTCFLTLIYAFDAMGRERPSKIAAHVLAQAAIWIGIKYGLFLMYGSNPGEGMFELHFLSNMKFMSVFKRMPTVISNLGGLWIPALLLYRYIPDRFVRRASFIVVPFFIGMAIVGNVYELRIYGELIPVVVPAVLVIIKELVLRFEGSGEAMEPQVSKAEAGMKCDT